MGARTWVAGMRRAGVVLAGAAFVAPVAWHVLTSFKTDAALVRIPPILPPVWTLEHYRAVITHPGLGRAVANSLVVSLLTTAMAVGLGGLAAYALARLPVPGRGGILTGILATTMFPAIATVTPLYLIIRGLGLRDTWWGLIVPYASFTLPLSIWVLTAFFREIPREVEEAAALDGCGRLAAIRHLILPLAAPGIASAAILVFISAWNEFLFALTFTASDASRTVPVAIALFPGLHEVPWGDVAAASLLLSLPALALTLAAHRRIVAGLTAGAFG